MHTPLVYELTRRVMYFGAALLLSSCQLWLDTGREDPWTLRGGLDLQAGEMGSDAEVDVEVDIGLDAEVDAEVDIGLDAEVDAEIDPRLDAEVDVGLDLELDLSPSCVPGLCELCDEEGELRAAVDDENCPSFTCQSRYLLITDNQTSERRCIFEEAQPREGRCESQGLCYEEEQYCQPTVETVMVVHQRCGDISDCSGDTPPTLTTHVGQTCESLGVIKGCDIEGRCTVVNTCEPLVSAGLNNRLCHLSEDKCGFYFRSAGYPDAGDPRSCEQLCAAEGRRCLEVFEDGGDGCNEDPSAPRLGCNEALGDALCFCNR